MVVRRKISNLDGPESHLINGPTEILLWGLGFWALFTSIMGELGHSFTTASDRYTYTVSVPNLYHSVGRQVVSALKEEAKHERHKAWLP